MDKKTEMQVLWRTWVLQETMLETEQTTLGSPCSVRADLLCIRDGVSRTWLSVVINRPYRSQQMHEMLWSFCQASAWILAIRVHFIIRG